MSTFAPYVVIMAVHVRGDFFARHVIIPTDHNFQSVIVEVQAVSSRRLCGRKVHKGLNESRTPIHYDLRQGLNSSVGRVGPKLTRISLTEEVSPVGHFLHKSSNVAQEARSNSPRQGLLCGEQLPISFACGNGDVKGRMQSNVATRHAQGTTIVQKTNILPKYNNGEQSTVPTANPRELKKDIVQAGRHTIHMPNVSTTREAIAILKNRQQQGIRIDSYTLVEVLKGLKQKDLTAARQVHDCITQSGMDKHPYVANTLLSAYVRCGRLQDARRVFDGLEKKTVVTWNSMIAGYAKSNHVKDALEVFNRMRQGDEQPGELTCLSLLKACASPLALKWGKEVHAYVRHAGLESDVRVGTALVQMYAKCGCINEARRVFEKLADRNVVTSTVMIAAYAANGSIDDARVVFDGTKNRNIVIWNTMIGAYAQSGSGLESYRLYLQMKEEGFIPDAITYVSILNASASAGALEWVKEVHSHAVQVGLASDLRVGTALVHMYAKSGSIDDARLVFDRMEKRDVVMWNTVIGAYAQSGNGVEACQLFLQMKREGFIPNSITYVSMLNAPASAGVLEWVKEVHSHALEAGLESDLRVSNALVHMYAKCGSIDNARLLFDRSKTRDVITWNTIIGAYSESGYSLEAYELFLQMQRAGFIPDAFTYVNVLNGSASAGDLKLVKEVHSHALKVGLESDLRVGTALVNMFAKCGSVDDAQLIFDRMGRRDVVTWTAMIGGLAQHGCGHEALDLFIKMNANGVKPNGTTFVAVLSACCHAGLLDDGRRLFRAMREDYGIEPTVVHYNCMVDLLGRVGDFEEAKLFIGDMRVEPDVVTWGALLGACKSYGNVELAELAAEEIFKLDPENSSAYVLLSNIYAAAGKWKEVSLVRTWMQEKRVRKEPGRSWIEVNNKIHDFVSGDTSHPEAKMIHTELNKLTVKLKAEGYVPDTQLVLHNIDEEDKKLALCSHSEKLAIAYGLMHVPREEPIRVYKNLRVCSDCHTAAKLISKVTGREIIARDANRFHHFKDGVCSCGDYW